MSGEEVKYSRSVSESHADDTRSTLGRVNESRQGVDRQHTNRAGQLNGGVGTDEVARGRGATRRDGENVDSGITNQLKTQNESGNDMLSRATRAARDTL